MSRTVPFSGWICAVLCIVSLAGVSAAGQEEATGGLATRNPLDEIKDELVRVLAEAGVPFTPEQERATALVLEESRRASEQLFGEVMNFSGGPPQGEQLDRARAGIAWMNEEFGRRVRQYLAPAQLAAWDAHEAARAAEAQEGDGTAGTSQQVQQIRINNNPFTTEGQFFGQPSSGGSYGFASGGGVQAQIIQRGGAGAWHGNYQLRFRDESLNARNPFASNKPPYQQRNITLNTSGPIVRNWLTMSGGFNQSEQDNADTVNAETADGPVRVGFTRPLVFRNGYVNGTLQLADAQSLHFNGNLQRYDTENQGVGGFTLPERGVAITGGNDNLGLRHVWFATDRLVQDLSVSSNRNHQDTVPATDGVALNVLGAFNGGGGNENAHRNRNGNFSALWIHSGDRWNTRTGGTMNRSVTNEVSRSNFAGAFTFSDLDAFRAGTPILYSVTEGNPELRSSQTEWSVFLQHELRASNRLSMFFGVRYEWQTNLDDHDNVDPRVGVAYVLAASTVVRAGVGTFHERINNGVENTLLRLDGARQREIVVNDPSFPDPFLAGRVSVAPPASRRVRADDLVAPRHVNSSVQLEQSLPGNLFVTASYDYHRGFHLLRSRDLNAPPPGGTVRPDPDTGNVWQLESTGLSTFKAIRLAMRQRFSIFNVNANYTREVDEGDSPGVFTAPADSHDLRAELARTVLHQLDMNVNAQLPWGVFLATNVSFRNGTPYTITTGLDDNGDGITNDRPPGVPRSSRRGPHRGNVSVNVSKAFVVRRNTLGGSANLNVFANVTNVFNRTNFGTPVGILTSPLFGRPNSAFDPRQIEVGLRFQF